MAIKGNPFAQRKPSSRPSLREIERQFSDVVADDISPAGATSSSRDSESIEPPETTREASDVPLRTDAGSPGSSEALKPTTNRQRSGNEAATNWQQTDNKPAPPSGETDNKPTTNRQRSDNPTPSAKSETDNETDNVSATNRQQTDNKTGNKPTTKPATKNDLADLSGLQERALIFLFESCRYNASRESEPVINAQLADVLKTTPHSAKVSLQRLEAKGFVRRTRFKNGRGGWAVFELPEGIYQALSVRETRNKLATNWQQTGNKTGNKPTTEPTTEPTTAPSSSSSSELEKENFNTTTTADASLGSGWDEIDCTPVTSIGLRFGRPQIQQIAKAGAVTHAELQDSILMFAFDLVHNRKRESIVGDPLAFFVGILRRGPYLPPQNYRSPEEVQKRAYLEWKRRDAEEREALDQAIVEVEFENWWRDLADAERRDYAPAKVGADGFPAGSPFHLQTVKEIFAKTVWPSLQAKIRAPLEARQGATTGDSSSSDAAASFDAEAHTEALR